MLSWRRWLWIATAVLFVASARDALAHRVNVFAYVEGDTVHVECSYSRSDRVRFGEITVQDAAGGQVYLTGKTDEQGNFAFAVPAAARARKADLRVVLKAGEGHQNDVLVKAEEYAGAAAAPAASPGDAGDQANGGAVPVPTVQATPAAQGAVASPMATAPTVPAAPLATGPATVAAPVAPGSVPAAQAEKVCPDAAAIEAAVETAVEKKIAPIRKMLVDDKEKGPGLVEIFGGVGWLVGLGGLAAYAKGRKGGKGA
ncbi:MAG: hypothetical protein ACP59X_10705 [Solidesulfovibrio sp. DCME]|uniref:hypothetical protein n=1 Tax=Solidesulfovibrio sp. DCME TaxID=3447380 RepID=UPI003D09E465